MGNEKQFQASQYWIDDTTEQILYGGAKAGGKSFLGCSLIFGDALIYPNTHYFIARKELADLRKFTVPSVIEVLSGWGIQKSGYKYNGQDNYFELSNGSKVFLISCTYLPSDPLFERFGSMQMTRGWIEEAGEVSEDAKRNLWISIGRWKNLEYGLKKKILITCNPKKGFLYREFYKPFTLGTIPESKKFIAALVYDNKTAPLDYIQSLEDLQGVSRQRLLHGNWEYDDSDDSLIDYDCILDSLNNTHVKQTGKRYITADIALQGSDNFVILVWDGFVCIHSEKIPKIGPRELVDKIGVLKRRFNVPNSHIAYDADGVGAYVGGWVEGAKAFHNGGSPKKVSNEKEDYANLKSQCYFKMAKRDNEHGYHMQALPESDREAYIEEMEQVKRGGKDPDGKLRIISKKEVKANIGRSPDITDAKMMRELFELTPPRMAMSGINIEDLN